MRSHQKCQDPGRLLGCWSNGCEGFNRHIDGIPAATPNRCLRSSQARLVVNSMIASILRQTFPHKSRHLDKSKEPIMKLKKKLLMDVAFDTPTSFMKPWPFEPIPTADCSSWTGPVARMIKHKQCHQCQHLHSQLVPVMTTKTKQLKHHPWKHPMSKKAFWSEDWKCHWTSTMASLRFWPWMS